MTDFWVTLLTGGALLMSSIFLAAREILLRPKHNPFPDAPFWLCTMMFAYNVAIFFTALTLLFSLDHPEIVYVHPAFLVLATAMMIYKGGMLANVIHQWMPAVVRTKIEGMNARVRELTRHGGVKGQALGILEAEGVMVIGPGEGADAIVAETTLRTKTSQRGRR